MSYNSDPSSAGSLSQLSSDRGSRLAVGTGSVSANRPVGTGNAGALARTAPHGAKFFQVMGNRVSSLVRASRSMRARAPAFPGMIILLSKCSSIRPVVAYSINSLTIAFWVKMV
ncbi:MAG TPA: hypothetical protein VK475_06860 [Pyrinomonadaceae bacterium]|nr:hypothetical protein [Pyrinomonadaceae bacterium]